MAFVPSEINMNERQRITDTKWSYIQQSPTMRFYFHDHLPASGDESYHVSVFMRQFGNGNETVQGGRRWPSGKRIKSSKEEKTILLFLDVAHKSGRRDN